MSLPPHLNNKSNYEYGTLKIDWVDFTGSSKFKGDYIKYYSCKFLGFEINEQIKIDVKSQKSITFKIVTNLWHFYAYLHDCSHIDIEIEDNFSCKYRGKLPFELTSSSIVFKKLNNYDFLFKNNSYLHNNHGQILMQDQKHQIVGTINLRLQLMFDRQIHDVLMQENLIQFQKILIINEISPIVSSSDLQNMSLQICDNLQKQQKTERANINAINQMISGQEIKEIPNFKSNFSSIIVHQEQEQKAMEDQIDRLIAEMQSKPYDSSRYAQQLYEIPSVQIKKQNFDRMNLSQPINEKGSNHQKANSIQKRQGSIELKLSKYPPLAKSMTSIKIKEQSISKVCIKQSQIRKQQKTKLGSNCYNQDNNRNRDIIGRKGYLKIKIHELLMQNIEPQMSFLLKMYFNDDQQEFYSTNGIKNGQAISFNSNLKIDYKDNLSIIRFQLYDTYNRESVHSTGQFDLNRLFSITEAKGIFFVNMNIKKLNKSASFIKADQSKLIKVIPNIKSLRIQLEYEESQTNIQVYIKLSNFTIPFKTCRYKIPNTKESIQFSSQPDHLKSKHVNIFPYNRKNLISKLIIQFWSDKSIIGVSEISLLPLHETNQNLLNCSLEPICLHDQSKDISDFFDKKVKGKYHLKLCYGSIKQVQYLLNEYEPVKPKRQQVKQKIQVQKHLGIYVLENKEKIKKQVQIQVELQDYQKFQKKISKVEELSLKQQQQIDEEIGGENSQNQFMNSEYKQKFEENNKNTVPISKPTLNNQTQIEFSKTLSTRDKKLRSLTLDLKTRIKQILLSLSNQKMFNALKVQFKQNLLYNFIDRQIFIETLSRFGVSNILINDLVNNILEVSGNMINVTTFYDLLYEIILNGQIKERYISDDQLGKYCVYKFYENVYKSSTDLSQQISQFVLKEQDEFKDVKVMFQKIGYKITMRQFNVIQSYLKQIGQRCRINNRVDWIGIRALICREIRDKQIEEQKIKQHQKEILSKIYCNKWQEDDDFFISNINERAENNPSLQISTKVHFEQSFPSDLIENKKSLKQYKDTLKQEISIQNNQCSGKIKLVKNNYRITLWGFENCVQSAECHLNFTFSSPSLKISYKADQNTKNTDQLTIFYEKNKSQYSLLVSLDQLETLDGLILLTDMTKIIARCAFSIMKDIKSVYTMKSLDDNEFCGLIHILFQQTF